METIKLGDRVKDKISGIKGIAIGVTEWLYGCRRVTVQPEESKDGKPADVFSVDEPQLDLVKAGIIVPPNRAESAVPKRDHGPRPDAGRHSDPRR